MEVREPLRNIIVNVLHDCRDGGYSQEARTKGIFMHFSFLLLEMGIVLRGWWA